MFKKYHKWILRSLALFLFLQATGCVFTGGPTVRDLEYVRGLSEPDVPLTLDLSDRRQRRLLVRQMRAANLFSWTNCRDLAASIEALRRAHSSAHAQGIRATTQDQTLLQQEEFGVRKPIGIVTQLHRTKEDAYHAEAWLSVPHTIHSTLLLQLYDAQTWEPVGDLAAVQDWLENFQRISADGASEASDVEALFLYLYDAEDGSPVTAQAIFKTLKAVTLATFTGVDPRKKDTSPPKECPGDPSNPNACIKVCLNRESAADCDYHYTMGDKKNRSIDIHGKVTFPEAVNNPPTGGRLLYIIQSASGGACKTDLATADCDTTTGTGFCIDPTDPNAITWTLGTQTFPTMDPCWDSAHEADFHLQFAANVGTSPPTIQVTSVDNAPAIGAQCNPNSFDTCEIPRLYFVWGCLPEGTPIRMADGSSKPIEKIEVREKVLADAAGRVLTVVDTFRGTEELPLVVVRDDQERTLRLTETHPVVTARGVLLAKELRVGDVLSTEKGTSEVVSVDRSEATEAVLVYNLRLGDAAAGEEVTRDNTTHFAAGILVGDSRMQGTSEREYRRGGRAQVPPEWRRDYRRWVRRQEGESGEDR